MLVPENFSDLPASSLPSTVLESAALYCAFSCDLEEVPRTASTFEDAVWLHKVFDEIEQSNSDGDTLQVEPAVGSKH